INARFIEELVDALRDGGVIVIPTDTRYALACDALSNRAIERICKLKGIDPKKHPLSIVCADMSQASEYAMIDNRAFKILRETLPGPYTYILPTTPRLPKAFKGRREVGVRVPDNEIARELARELGNPLMTSTVSWPGADDDDTLMPAAIADALEREVDYVVDAGDSTASLTSIIDLTDSTSPVTIR
ncbi:MAG: threonylcarbamoyl-AMP synthase, partial [Muribaculaceae bacterium]|nr:threonylcarbamoyl-AMP synthase [Muribaculaceae bacterium]